MVHICSIQAAYAGAYMITMHQVFKNKNNILNTIVRTMQVIS